MGASDHKIFVAARAGGLIFCTHLSVRRATLAILLQTKRTMASGTLPGATYHRASHLGAGTFGSVVVVYNDDGEEYALKLFRSDDHDMDDNGQLGTGSTNNADDDSDDEEYKPRQPIALGALREISCLRLLRGAHQHSNIVSMVDVQTEWSSDEDGGGGAGTSGCLSMALPLGKHGSLASALQKNLFMGCPQATKVKLAHGILSAVLYLHDNGILHRDVKSDNILLESSEDGDSLAWKPVLIDFSLAKPVDGTMWNTGTSSNNSLRQQQEALQMKIQLESLLHTGDVGTLVYNAPEVMAQEGYGKPADLYSVGVVLLELARGQLFTAEKAKQASAQIARAIASLPASTLFASLIRSLLTTDQDERISARDALNHAVFAKFGLLNSPPESHIIDIASALPYDKDNGDVDTENAPPNLDPSPASTAPLKKRRQTLERRLTLIDKMLQELVSDHPWTRWTALEYSIQLEELDDSNMEDCKNSQALADCCVLAHRFWELDLVDLNHLDSVTTGPFTNWSLDGYVDTEATIFMLLDYCLYPRMLSFGNR
jgi:serine/threonine protein kinase